MNEKGSKPLWSSHSNSQMNIRKLNANFIINFIWSHSNPKRMFFRLCSNDVSYHLLYNMLAKFAVLLSHLYKNSIQVNLNYRKLEQYFIDFNKNKSLYKDIALSRGSCLFCCFATNKQGVYDGAKKTCSYVHVNVWITTEMNLLQQKKGKTVRLNGNFYSVSWKPAVNQFELFGFTTTKMNKLSYNLG